MTRKTSSTMAVTLHPEATIRVVVTPQEVVTILAAAEASAMTKSPTSANYSFRALRILR